MPIEFLYHKDGELKGKPSCINIVLGYGDIGIGVLHFPEDTKYGKLKRKPGGCAFVQLSKRYKRGESPKGDVNWGQGFTFNFIARNKKGLASLRDAVRSVEESMGLNNETMMDKIITSTLDERGELEAEIEKLEFEKKKLERNLARYRNVLAKRKKGKVFDNKGG